MGSIFAVPLLRLAVSGLVDLCRTWPGDVVGAHLQATEDYRRAYRQPALLVIGSEGRGLSPAVAGACPLLVRIPMRDGVDSLNVAAAAALLLFEARHTAMPALRPS
jgi:TrmH family RNA methyltransferase